MKLIHRDRSPISLPGTTTHRRAGARGDRSTSRRSHPSSGRAMLPYQDRLSVKFHDTANSMTLQSSGEVSPGAGEHGRVGHGLGVPGARSGAWTRCRPAPRSMMSHADRSCAFSRGGSHHLHAARVRQVPVENMFVVPNVRLTNPGQRKSSSYAHEAAQVTVG